MKKIIILLLFSSFLFGLDLNLKCSSSNTSNLFAEYKELSKKTRNSLETKLKILLEKIQKDDDINSILSELENISFYFSKTKNALKRKSKAIKCATNQKRANKIQSLMTNNKSGDYYWESGEALGTQVYKLAEYLEKTGKTKALKKLVKFINDNRADDLKYIKWKGGNIFALDIGYKNQYPNKFYVGFFYTAYGNKISYIQYTADRKYFQKGKRIKLSSLSKLKAQGSSKNLRSQLKDKTSQIVLAYILENWLGLQPEVSLQSYLRFNQIKFKLSKNLEFSQIINLKYGAIVAVKGITPTLDEVANYLRSGSYTLRIRSKFKDELVFINGQSQITIDFPTKNLVVIKKKTHNYVAEDDSTVISDNIFRKTKGNYSNYLKCIQDNYSQIVSPKCYAVHLAIKDFMEKKEYNWNLKMRVIRKIEENCLLWTTYELEDVPKCVSK